MAVGQKNPTKAQILPQPRPPIPRPKENQSASLTSSAISPARNNSSTWTTGRAKAGKPLRSRRTFENRDRCCGEVACMWAPASSQRRIQEALFLSLQLCLQRGQHLVEKTGGLGSCCHRGIKNDERREGGLQLAIVRE